MPDDAPSIQGKRPHKMRVGWRGRGAIRACKTEAIEEQAYRKAMGKTMLEAL
jgi:hypothetical protein